MSSKSGMILWLSSRMLLIIKPESVAISPKKICKKCLKNSKLKIWLIKYKASAGHAREVYNVINMRYKRRIFLKLKKILKDKILIFQLKNDYISNKFRNII